MTRRGQRSHRAGRVGRVERAVHAALAATTALGALLLLLLVVVVPDDDLDAGVRALRLAHVAVLEQESGLRGFLLTNQDRALEPYRHGRSALPAHEAAALRAVQDRPALGAAVRAAQERRRAWVDGWALLAVGGVPEGEAASTFTSRGAALFAEYRTAQAVAERAVERAQERVRARQDRLLVTGLLLEAAALAALAAGVHRAFGGTSR